MWWLLLIPTILILLAVMPVGVIVRYADSGFTVWLKILFVRYRLYPSRKKTDNKHNEDVDDPKAHFAVKEIGGKISAFLPIVKTIAALLSELRRRIRINDLRIKLVLAGDDPCDLSINYGRVWTAVGNLQPYLNRFLNIKKQELDIQCDYTADSSTVFCYAHLTVPLIRLLCILVCYGTKLYKQHSDLKNNRKGGIANESETSPNA